MVLLYLLTGCMVYTSYDVAPVDILRDVQSRARARRRDVLLAVVVWCIALAFWPLAIVLRAGETVRRRRSSAMSGCTKSPRHPHIVTVYMRNEGR